MPNTSGPRRPVRQRARLIGVALATSVLAASGAGAQPTAPSLSLSEALSRAATSDPSRSAREARILAGQAGVRQADVRPNPPVLIDATRPVDLVIVLDTSECPHSCTMRIWYPFCKRRVANE